MTKTRWWSAGAVLVMAVLVVLGWFLGIDPRLAEARSADNERVGVEALNATYEQKLVKLEQVDKNLPALTAQLDKLNAALPPDAQVSTLLGQLNALAAESGVELTSITAGVPQRFGAADETATAAAAPVAAESEAAAEQPAADATAPDGTSSDATATDTAAASPMENFVSVPISVEFTGDPRALLAFVEKVQYGTRLFLVEAFDITYDGGGGKVKMDGFVYVLRDSAAAAEVKPAAGN